MKLHPNLGQQQNKTENHVVQFFRSALFVPFLCVSHCASREGAGSSRGQAQPRAAEQLNYFFFGQIVYMFK